MLVSCLLVVEPAHSNPKKDLVEVMESETESQGHIKSSFKGGKDSILVEDNFL